MISTQNYELENNRSDLGNTAAVAADIKIMNTPTITVHCQKECGFVDEYEPIESGTDYYEAIGTCSNCDAPMVDGDGNKTARLMEFIIKHEQTASRIVTLSEVRCVRCNMNASPLSSEGLCGNCNREPYVPEPISRRFPWVGFAVIAFVGALFIAAMWFLGR